MKYLLLITFIAFEVQAASVLSGKVAGTTGCSKKAMVWLSLDKEDYKERLLLMHTEVPQEGTFSFYVKPGNYQIRASDESGCEFFERVSIKTAEHKMNIRLVKK